MIKKRNKGEFYHISSENYVSIRNLIKLICKIYNYDFKNLVIDTKDRIGKDQFYKLSSKKIKKFGWKAKISLTEGIKKTGNWLINT